MKLVTGARGFIGNALALALEAHKVCVRRAVRSREYEGDIAVGDIGPHTDWSGALKGVDTVIHCAGIAHRPTIDPARTEDFETVNVAGTSRLAEQAADYGVKRLIYLSSTKAMGETTQRGYPFGPYDHQRPAGAYGVSKLRAEQALLDIAARTSLEVVIIRPSLVYGPGVKANFLALMRWIYRGMPLPFGSIDNRRSLISLSNLVDLILVCADHPAAADQVFLAADGEDLSTAELIRRLARYLNKIPRLIGVPESILRFSLIAAGRRGMAERLIDSLQVDIRQTKIRLDWAPRQTVNEGLKEVADWYLSMSRETPPVTSVKL